jgi:hypothetical protein
MARYVQPFLDRFWPKKPVYDENTKTALFGHNRLWNHMCRRMFGAFPSISEFGAPCEWL